MSEQLNAGFADERSRIFVSKDIFFSEPYSVPNVSLRISLAINRGERSDNGQDFTFLREAGRSVDFAVKHAVDIPVDESPAELCWRIWVSSWASSVRPASVSGALAEAGAIVRAGDVGLGLEGLSGGGSLSTSVGWT